MTNKNVTNKRIQMIIVGFKIASNEHKVLLINMSYFTSEKIEGPTIKIIRKLLRLTET